ncbi:hypothetical protein T459_11781 [Capsicum annuum]|uniref:Zinc finger PMZ-type domain-containing protein n=1 Tax=Capsicum annuum TaxID=4072 RepID=A0A2G2ZMX2_CAPAN|nr:hypothetical protein T459_11781 [Capsicum annuum]
MNARTNFSSINMSKITLAASNTPRAAIRKSRLKSLHCSVRICIAKERVRTLVRFRGSFSRILAVDQPIGNVGWGYDGQRKGLRDTGARAHFPNNRYDVITRNIIESINSMLISEREYLVASIFNLISKRFGAIFRKRPAYVLKYKDNKFVSTDEKIINDNMCEDDFFYIENLNVGENQFTMFGKGPTAKVNLLEKSCSCRRFDLVKIPWAYTMAALRSKHGDDYGLTTYQYTSLVYKVEEYLLVYSESINVVLLYSE